MTGSARLRGASSALLDQIVSSGSNLLIVILVLRSGDVLTFGAFSVAFAVHGLLLGVMRATVGDVTLLRIRRDPDSERATADAAVTVVGIVTFLLALPIIALGALLPAPLQAFVIALGVLLPAIHIQDVQRYIAFGLGRPQTALSLDVLWLLVQIATTIAVLVAHPNPVLVVYAWGLGAAVSAGYGLVASARRLLLHDLGELARGERRRARTYFADYVLSNGLGQLALLGLSGILSLVGFGLFRLALTVVGAVTNVLGSARSLVFASMAGQPDPGPRMLRLWAGATLSFGLLAIGFAAGLVLLPPAWGVALFGPAWLTVRPLLLLAGAAEAVRVMAFPSSDFVRAHGSGRRLVLTRAIAAISVALGLLLGGLIAGVQGALLWLFCAQAASLLAWLVQAHRTRQQRFGELAASASPRRPIS